MLPLELLLEELAPAEVVDRHLAVAAPDGQQPAVAAQAEGADAIQIPVQDRLGGGAAQQRGQQVAASLQGVVQGDTLPGQQQGMVEVVFEQRLGAEATGVGDQRLAFGPAAQGKR